MSIREVTVYYLQMNDPGQFRPKWRGSDDVVLSQVEIPLPELNRFLYASVGVDWHWTDRLYWNYQQWQQWLERPAVQTWIGYLRGTPTGYFELEKQVQDDGQVQVEIAYFGILPGFTGQGIGAHLLSGAIDRAWQLNADRVWLHTCTLDHPVALANYRARGFKLYRQETVLQPLPDEPLELWPGALGPGARNLTTGGDDDVIGQ
jgi:GNAT superfamily N-acetyltransferase